MKKFHFFVASAILTCSAVSSCAQGTASDHQDPEYYRAKLGVFQVTAFSDGTAPRHLDQILSDPDVANAECGTDHEAEPVEPSIHANFINTGTHMILIDTGVIASIHISFPGFSHVRKTDSGYKWYPVPYSASITELDPK